MNCETAQAYWHQRCDGELDPADCTALELHLRNCAACRTFVEEMDSVVGSLDNLRRATATVGLSQRLPSRYRLQAMGSLAAAIALALTAALVWRSPEVAGPDHATSPLPSAGTGSAPSASAGMPAAVHLARESNDRFIAVERESDTPNVHVFVLFQKTGGHRNAYTD